MKSKTLYKKWGYLEAANSLQIHLKWTGNTPRSILSPLRLPISPPGQGAEGGNYRTVIHQGWSANPGGLAGATSLPKLSLRVACMKTAGSVTSLTLDVTICSGM